MVFTRIDQGLYVVDDKGGTPRLIARSYMAWWLESPAWSPDGSRIDYTDLDCESRWDQSAPVGRR